MIFYFRKPSAWTFVTSGGGGANIEFLAASGGEIVLNDPSGKETRFHYGGAGLGLGIGARLPKVGKVVPRLRGRQIGAGGSPEAFPNIGRILITDQFAGNELRRSDITGMCLFAEASAGIFGGGSATALMLNVNPAVLLEMSNPALQIIDEMFHLRLGPKAVLFMAGLNVGLQAGAGVAGYCGYLG